MPNIQKKTHVSRVGQALIFILLTFILIVLSFMAYLKSQGYDVSNLSIKDIKAFYYSSTDEVQKGIVQKEIEYLQSEHPVFTTYKEYIVKCTVDNVKYYSIDGEEIFNKNITLKNPIVKTNGKELLLADTGSKEVYVFKDKDLKWNYKMDGNIINAEINQTGHVSVVHESKGYKSAVTVFNLQGGPFFTRSISDSIAIKANVSPKAQHVAASMLDTTGIGSLTDIEVTNILGSPVGEKITGVNDLISNILYMDSELAICVGNNVVLGVDAKNQEKWRTAEENYRFGTATKLDGKNALIVSTTNEKGLLTSELTSKLIKVNTEGKISELFKSQGYIKNISANDGVIGVNFGKEVVFVSYSGIKLGSYSPKIDVNQVSIINSNIAAVITKTAVEIIKIN